MLPKAGSLGQQQRPLSLQPGGASSRVPINPISRTAASKNSYSSVRIKKTEPLVVSVHGEDYWRLDPIVELLKKGGVGIIPTDTLPALVADLENREAVLRLYKIKELDPKKPLSILCRGFQDISQYTTGFPAPNLPGQPNWFNTVRRILPGPYTLILGASKNLPSQCVDFMKGKNLNRKSVGVRMPDDDVCKAILEGLGGPLLCTSAHTETRIAPDTEVPDVGSMLDAYKDKGIDFIVDVGKRIATQSTVVDMTGATPEIIREGRGDSSPFQQ